jgi:hypothetical protein
MTALDSEIKWVQEIAEPRWDSTKHHSQFDDAKYWTPTWRMMIRSSRDESGKFSLLEVAIAASESESEVHACLKECAECCAELCCNEDALSMLTVVPYEGAYETKIVFEFQYRNRAELLGIGLVEFRNEPRNRETLLFSQPIVIFNQNKRHVETLRGAEITGKLTG